MDEVQEEVQGQENRLVRNKLANHEGSRLRQLEFVEEFVINETPQ